MTEDRGQKRKGTDMRKLMMLLAGLAFLLNGCSGAGVQSDQFKLIVVKSAARMLGYKIAESDRNLVEPAKTFCKLLSTGSVDDAVVETAKSFLMQNTNDSVLMATLTDVIDLVRATTGGTEDKGIYNPELVRFAALYVLDGITIYENGNGRDQDTGIALNANPKKEKTYGCEKNECCLIDVIDRIGRLDTDCNGGAGNRTVAGTTL